MILRKERLHRFDLCDGESGFTGVECLERLEHRNWRGIDIRRLLHYCFLFNPVEKHVMERPVFFIVIKEVIYR
jgi:hypothetical protein